jgi:hypothetical protein
MKQVAIWIDQGFNVVIGGKADETISARAWRLRSKSKWWFRLQLIIDAMFFWQPNHCEQSYVSELLRKQLPAEYRQVCHKKFHNTAESEYPRAKPHD